jgi:hypothetical protein
MKGEVTVGTVRGTRNDGRHVLVRRDGTTMDVRFEGSIKPLVGADVIGRISYSRVGEAVMTLKPSLSEALLEGNARIMTAGSNPDLTARMLAKMLARSKSATIAPGVGSSIRRSPTSADPDLSWALSKFGPEADRLRVALNVIDVQKVARSIWQNSDLRDGSLPADIEGSQRSMNELVRLLRSGFHPACSRAIETYTGNREISVNFVLPYSPFAGAHGFAREASRMDLGTAPRIDMSISEARRLSSARTLALAIAHKALSAGAGMQADVTQSPRAAHLANCIADAAAVLAFLADGGRRQAVEEYAALKESSFYFGVAEDAETARPGVLVEATHNVMKAALEERMGEGMSMRAILSTSARLAKKHAFGVRRFEQDAERLTTEELDAGAEAANRIAIDLRDHSGEPVVLECAEAYRDELRALVDEYEGDRIASTRLQTFGQLHAPHAFWAIFEEETAHLSEDAYAPTVSQMIADRSMLADRLRRARSRPAVEDDVIEFAEPFAP